MPRAADSFFNWIIQFIGVLSESFTVAPALESPRIDAKEGNADSKEPIFSSIGDIFSMADRRTFSRSLSPENKLRYICSEVKGRYSLSMFECLETIALFILEKIFGTLK